MCYFAAIHVQLLQSMCDRLPSMSNCASIHVLLYYDPCATMLLYMCNFASIHVTCFFPCMTVHVWLFYCPCATLLLSMWLLQSMCNRLLSMSDCATIIHVLCATIHVLLCYYVQLCYYTCATVLVSMWLATIHAWLSMCAVLLCLRCYYSCNTVLLSMCYCALCLCYSATIHVLLCYSPCLTATIDVQLCYYPCATINVWLLLSMCCAPIHMLVSLCCCAIIHMLLCYYPYATYYYQCATVLVCDCYYT